MYYEVSSIHKLGFSDKFFDPSSFIAGASVIAAKHYSHWLKSRVST
jgi:hypothetical protein